MQNLVNTANGVLGGNPAKQIQILYILFIIYLIYLIYYCSLFSVLTRSPFTVIKAWMLNWGMNIYTENICGYLRLILLLKLGEMDSHNEMAFFP